jgi:RimJ/RimL family protein N-acetyltransferase
VTQAIATARLLLEPWGEAVRDDWIALNSDPEVSRWLGTGEVIPGSYSESEHELMLAQWQHHGFGWRSAIDAESGEWIGAAGLNYIRENPSGLPAEEIEFGWWLNCA